jgi:hypothetical protein
VEEYSAKGGGAVAGLVPFLNNVLKFMVIVAGIYTLVNIVLAGYAFISAGNDAKKIADAWAKIWQSLIGLLIVAGSFLLAALIGWLLFENIYAIITPIIYTP